jgi:hypothetical protein
MTAETISRDLIDRGLYDRLAARIVADHRFERRHAERIVDQTLAFLRACADNPGTTISPSPMVDVGWHAFILHTREYAEFCDRVAGRFIHHEPLGADACKGSGGCKANLATGP